MNSTDRLPPHAPDAEAGIIGAAIQDPNLIPELRREWFYDYRLATLADVLVEMFTTSKPIDSATVTELAAKAGIPEAVPFINECLEKSPSPANFAYWRGILRECLGMREALRFCAETTRKVHEIAAETTPNLMAY